MTSTDSSLTGVWDGLYSYPSRAGHPETPFTVVLFDGGGTLSGTVHETMRFSGGSPIAASAFLDGSVEGSAVHFLKTYDGSGGQTHSVTYDGTLSGDRGEIDGTWTVRAGSTVVSGRFLMIRGRRAAKAAKRKIAVKA